MSYVTDNRGVSRILVVEDEFLIAEDIAMTLGDLAFGVVGPAPTVGAALALIDREAPDLAVIDLNLDGESSAPVAEALRARGVPYILASGYDCGQLDEHLLEGVARITKPFSSTDLAKAIDEALSNRAELQAE